jgi:hypothetical protein
MLRLIERISYYWRERVTSGVVTDVSSPYLSKERRPLDKATALDSNNSCPLKK